MTTRMLTTCTFAQSSFIPYVIAGALFCASRACAGAWTVDPIRLGGLSIQTTFVERLAYSPDGKLFTVFGNGDIGLCNGTTGEILATFPAPVRPILGLAFDGRDRLITVSAEGQLSIWDVRTKQWSLINDRVAESRLVDFAFSSATPSMLATVSHNDIVQVWTLASEEERLSVQPGPKYRGTAAAFSADGQRLAFGGGPDGMIHVRDLKTGAESVLPEAWTRELTELRFLQGGKGLVSNGYPRRGGPFGASAAEEEAHTANLAVWDLSSRQLVRTLTIESDVYRSCRLVVSGDGRILAAVTHRALILWRTDDWSIIRELRGDVVGGSFLRRVALSVDGGRMAVGDLGRETQLWAPLDGRRIPQDERTRGLGLARVAASTDAQRVVTASLDGTVLVWARASETLLMSANAKGRVTSVAVSPRGENVVVGAERFDNGKATSSSVRGRCLFWTVADGKARREIETPVAPTALRFSPDGRFLAIAASSPSGEDPFADPPRAASRIAIWGTAKEGLCHEFGTELEDVFSMQFAVHANQLAALTRTGAAALWDYRAGTLLASLDLGSGLSVLGPDGNTVFQVRNVPESSEQTLRSTMLVQRIEPAGHVCEWDLPLGVAEALAASRKGAVAVFGRAAATAGTPGPRVIEIYRDSTGAPLLHCSVPVPIHSLAFSDDGEWLAAGLGGGSALVWCVGPNAR